MLDVTIGRVQQHRNLTVYPLLAAARPTLPYALLADAVADGVLTITEVGTGTVPSLLAKNTADSDVLVLDGEQLVGSRQNRMTNRSILLPAHDATEVPVYCMEQGRWHFTSDAMKTAPQHSPSKMRRRARETEVRVRASGKAASLEDLAGAQTDIWSDVAETIDSIGGHSQTFALDAAYDANTSRIDEWLHAFPAHGPQVGLLAFADDTPLGLDLIGCIDLYARVHTRLLRGYIVDAMESATRRTQATAAPAAEHAQRFLDSVRTAQRSPAPTVGKGTYHVLSGDVIGGELLDGDRVPHLSAFPTRREPHRGRSHTDEAQMASPRRRRRHRLDE